MEHDAPITLPRYRLGYLAPRLAGVVLGVFLLTLVGGRLAQFPYATPPAALLAALVAGLWARSQRVEFGRSSVTARRIGSSREVAYDEIERAELRWHGENGERLPHTAVTARICPRGGAPFDIESTWRELRPAWERLNEPLRAKRRATLTQGEVLTFRDASAAPWLSAVWAVAVTLSFAMSLVTHRGVVMAGVLLAVSLWSLRRELHDWRLARAAGGVALSAEGLRELRRDGSQGSGGYRGVRGPAQGWVPWREVRWVLLDGGSLRIATAQHAEPIYVSGSAELDALYELLIEHFERHRAPVDATIARVERGATEATEAVETPGVTGVRVALDAPQEALAASPLEVEARSKAATRGR